MRNKKRYLILSAILIFIAGCGQNIEQKLIGTWKAIGGNEQIFEFLKDGSYIIKLKKNEIGSLENLKGKWQILSNGRLKLDVSALGMKASQVGKLTFEGNEMIFTDDKGKSTRHIKLKETS